MILLLSGATHPDAEQRDIMASTGGYISITPVPNGAVNTLFDDITCYGMNKKIKEVMAIFLRNDSGEVKQNIVLQQIYPHNNGKETKCAKFEWAAVEPKDNNFIEKVGNRRNMPYNAEFFDPVAKREFAVLKILTTGQAGDVVEVLGRDGILGGSDISDVVFTIVDMFDEDLDYNVWPAGEDSVYIERKELIFTGDPIELTTPGNATAEPVDFSGGVDEGVLLIEEMQPGETIGLWIRRSIKGTDGMSCEQLEEEYDALFGPEFSEERVEDHTNNEECHEVILSWD